MNSRILFTIRCLLVAAGLVSPGRAEQLAWLKLGDPNGQTYLDTPYHWLGDRSLHLTVTLPPGQDGHFFDMLWGSKNDQRGAVITAAGSRRTVRFGGFRGFQWYRIELPAVNRQKQYSITIESAPPKAAFLAAVRIATPDTPPEEPLPNETNSRIALTTPPPHELYTWIEQLQAKNLDAWQRAEIYARQANEALRRCRRYVDGWLAHADPETGLIPQNLRKGRKIWNGRNAAADNYAFMVLTCALTDRALFKGRMLEMLRTETGLTNRIGALPDHYNFEKQDFQHEEIDLQRLIFDGSEYVKDGLMPITEWLEETAWSERMVAIIDSIVEHVPFDTPRGKIPSNNVEVNGEMMQVLSRLCFMTENDGYLDMACRIADYYLLGNNHPTRNATKLGLRDHNCELISGITEVYAACHFRRRQKIRDYRGPVREMLDRILEVGINEHGLMYDMVNPQTGKILKSRISDNWGYNYNGFYTVFLLDSHDPYRTATRLALSNLNPHYRKFPWQGWGSDGIADAVEGAVNLLNREPDVKGVPEWIDANTSRMLLIQKPDGTIEGWHGDGNYAQTAILWALWKQQGVTLLPWRKDVKLGAVRNGRSVQLLLSTDAPWSGRLIFDSPRHKTVMQIPIDYPRINQFPEWFTIQADEPITVKIGNKRNCFAGEKLTEGLPITLDAKETVRITVSRDE